MKIFNRKERRGRKEREEAASPLLFASATQLPLFASFAVFFF
jgi:hypothetical protein